MPSSFVNTSSVTFNLSSSVVVLEPYYTFPLPRLKIIDRRFRAKKAFCGSQVRNISCTTADIWKASKYRRLDLQKIELLRGQPESVKWNTSG